MEDEQLKMSRMNLRTFTASIILVGAVIGLTLEFSSGFLAGAGQTFDEEDSINQIREGFANESQEFTREGQGQVDEVSIQTDFFFLSEVWNVITSITGGLRDILGLITAAGSLTGLPIPQSVYSLTGIIVAGVVFALVSAARGWDV